MLLPRHIVFTAVEGTLFDPSSRSCSGAEDALAEIDRRHIPLVLSGSGTRAQLELLRRKIAHAHPFFSESGGGIFFPDSYFSVRLENVVRIARYLCVPFGKDYVTASAAVQEIAAEARANVVGYSQMSPREIASNGGRPLHEAELERQREFSERFFFAGDTGEDEPRFSDIARQRGWQATPGQPFWELSSGNDPGRAVRYLTGLYRDSLRTRLSSIGIGSTAEHLPLLLAVDQPVLLPYRGQHYDSSVLSRLPHIRLGAAVGAVGWNQAVLDVLKPATAKKL